MSATATVEDHLSIDEQIAHLQEALNRAIQKRDASWFDDKAYRRFDDLVRKLAKSLDELKTPSWF